MRSETTRTAARPGAVRDGFLKVVSGEVRGYHGGALAPAPPFVNFTCNKCQRRYSIADEKVRGRTVKIRCKNCRNVVSVQGPADEERTTMMSFAEMQQLRAETGAAPAPV